VVAGGGLLGWIGGGLVVGDVALSGSPLLAESGAHTVAGLIGATIVVLLGLGLKRRLALKADHKQGRAGEDLPLS